MLRYDVGNGRDQGWLIGETVFNPRFFAKCESIMAQGNGYLGLRATLEEEYVGQRRNLFIAGTFNRFDQFEPVELPNAADVVGLEIILNQQRFALDQGVIHSYERYLNLRTGELIRKVIWESPTGERYKLIFARFVSLVNWHLIGTKIEITPLSGDARVKLTSGINGQMTNSGVQHFHEGEKRVYDHVLELIQTTTQSKIHFVFNAGHRLAIDGEAQSVIPAIASGRRKIALRYELVVPKGKTLTLEKLVTIHTSQDQEVGDKEDNLAALRDFCRAEFRKVKFTGYDRQFSASAERWQRYWERAGVEIQGQNPFDQLAIRFAQYHLVIMTPAHDDRFGIGAKGLTGEGYKGHSFWDSEIFILPYFMLTDPKVAQGLLKYRYHTLDGARRKALANGYEGAMYPWESALTGEEETPAWAGVNVLTGEPTPVLSGLKEHHITADIAYALWQYYQATADTAFMEAYGSEILFATATFWASRLQWDEKKNAYCLNDVIGPDEYKERVNNNAYTNYLAHWNLKTAIGHYEDLQAKQTKAYLRLKDQYNLEQACLHWRAAVDKIYLPSPRPDGVIPQDDTYLSKPELEINKYRTSPNVQMILQDYSREQVNSLQVSKQADVVMLMYLLGEKFSEEIKEANWLYYEPKTLHDSSLSMSVHSLVASAIGKTETAYAFFQKAAQIDLGPHPHSSDEGIHAAALGGVWQAVIFGFAGVRVKDGNLCLAPQIPSYWFTLKFSLWWRGYYLKIEVTATHLQIEVQTKREEPMDIYVGDQCYSLQSFFRCNL